MSGCSDDRKALDGVAQVAALRVRIEHWVDVAKKESGNLVTLAKAAKDDQKVQAIAGRVAATTAAYDRARDDFDAWIRTLIEAIKANTDIATAAVDPHSAYSIALAAVAKSADEYIAKAKAISDNATVAAAASLTGDLAVAEVTDAINQAAIALYREYQPATKQRKDEIIAALQMISLHKWDETSRPEAPVVVVEPWNKRAEAAVRTFVTRAVAESIVTITHHSGKDPVMTDVAVSDLGGDRLAVDITVDWKGGILGRSYQTKVEWTFSKAAHESAKVVTDNAFIKISADNLVKLNDYFMQTVYPPLKHSLD